MCFQEAKRPGLTLEEDKKVKSWRDPPGVGGGKEGKERVHFFFFPLDISRTHTRILSTTGLVFLNSTEDSFLSEGRDACSKCHIQWESRMG